MTKRINLLTRQQAADELDISLMTLRRWELAGILRPLRRKRPGTARAGWVRYRENDVEAMKQHRGKA